MEVYDGGAADGGGCAVDMVMLMMVMMVVGMVMVMERMAVEKHWTRPCTCLLLTYLCRGITDGHW